MPAEQGDLLESEAGAAPGLSTLRCQWHFAFTQLVPYTTIPVLVNTNNHEKEFSKIFQEQGNYCAELD